MEGIIMDLATPLICKYVDNSERELILHRIVSCILSPHEKQGVVHGDIKPSNMLLCRDRQLRLCDFAEARPIAEDPTVWEGDVKIKYASPTRTSYSLEEMPAPPTVDDDLDGLDISIWELYTGETAFTDVYFNDVIAELKKGRAVEAGLIPDKNLQKRTRTYLRIGGAKI